MTHPRLRLSDAYSPALLDLFEVLLGLSTTPLTSWTLIGGQMILLHGLEHDRVPPRISTDGDVLADVRATPAALRTIVSVLEREGFTSAGISGFGIRHRWTRDSPTMPGAKVIIDVLAPEGLGERTDLTTRNPGRTVEVPGGTQALARSEPVDITVRGHTGVVYRPNLLGALVAKAAAISIINDDPARHLSDVAFLASLVPDPATLRAQLAGRDRRRLSNAADLLQPGNRTWAGFSRDDAANARAVLRLLIAGGVGR